MFMDMIRIGRFIAQLRRERGLTQEQLGEILGVTNKTISRWETGSYLPGVEMLQLLSKTFSVSVTELLAGERLTAETFPQKAEETVNSLLQESSFDRTERYDFWKRKWQREHRYIWVIVILLFLLAIYIGLKIDILWFVAGLISVLLLIVVHRNRMFGYIESHIYQSPHK